MGQVTVAGVQYSNPQQKDQTTLTFPSDAVTPGYPPNVNGSLAGVTWQQNGPTAYPQPGTFVSGTPLSSPVVFNSDPPVVGKGQPIFVSGANGSTGNPSTDLNRQVSGTIANTSVTFRNPA